MKPPTAPAPTAREDAKEMEALQLLKQKEMAALNGETAAITLGLRQTRLIIEVLEAELFKPEPATAAPAPEAAEA